MHSGRAHLRLTMVTNPVWSPGINTWSWAAGGDAAVTGSGLGGTLQGWEAGGVCGFRLAVSPQCLMSHPGVGGVYAQTFALAPCGLGASLCTGGWAWAVPASCSGGKQVRSCGS